MYLKKWIPALLATVILGGVTWKRESLANHEGADALAADVVRARDAIPERVGLWVGHDIEPQQAAVKLLRPNILFQRVYANVGAGEQVTVLVVHTRDVRDMVGHFPPVCYRGQGWTLVSSAEVPICFSGHKWVGMDYQFRTDRGGRPTSILVRNFMLLPLVGVGRDMDSVRSKLNALDRRFFGAGQVQIIFEESMGAERREQVSNEMLKVYEPLLDAVLGMKADGKDGLTVGLNDSSTRLEEAKGGAR